MSINNYKEEWDKLPLKKNLRGNEALRAVWQQNPKTMLVALYSDAVREVLGKVETKYVVHAREDGRQEVRLLIGPEPVTPGASKATE